MASSFEANTEKSGDDLYQHNADPERVTSRNEKRSKWKRFLGVRNTSNGLPSPGNMSLSEEEMEKRTRPEKWSLGVLNDRETEEVPGKSDMHHSPSSKRQSMVLCLRHMVC